MNRQLSEFLKHVLQFTRSQDSMIDRVVSFFGMSDSTRQLSYQLQKSALSFADSYRANDMSAMRAAAKQVEANVLASQAVSAITSEAGDQILDELYNLIENKR